MNKQCARCKEIKDCKDFNKCHNRKFGRDGYCKMCASAIRTYRMYGLDENDFIKLLEKYNYECCICKKKFLLDNRQEIKIDHKHTNNQKLPYKPRGILCDTCNRGLGFLKDSTEIIDKIILYLKEHNKN